MTKLVFQMYSKSFVRQRETFVAKSSVKILVGGQGNGIMSKLFTRSSYGGLKPFPRIARIILLTRVTFS